MFTRVFSGLAGLNCQISGYNKAKRMDTIDPVQKTPEDGSSELLNGSSSSLASATSTAATNRNHSLRPTLGSPYPGLDDSPISPFQSLAESAVNAQQQLQQQISLMAMAMQQSTTTTQNSATTSFPSLFAAAASVANPIITSGTSDGDPTAGLSTIIDQYVVAATAASIQQQQDAAVAAIYNQAPSLMNDYSAPLAAYLPTQHQSAQQSDFYSSTAASQIQLLQQRNIINLANNANPTSATVFCPCGLTATMTAAAARTTNCPYHRSTHSVDVNANGSMLSNQQRQRVSDDNNNTDEMLIQQQQQGDILLSNSTSQQSSEQLRQQTLIPQIQVGIVQPMSVTAVQSNRMSHAGSSLKRSSGAAFSGSNGNLAVANPHQQNESNNINNALSTNAVSSASFNTHISSPSTLFSPNSTSIRLASGGAINNQQQSQQNNNIDNTRGSTRAPKLRRIVSFENVGPEPIESTSPAVHITPLTAAGISATNTATAAALVQLQQQAAAAAALPSTASAMLSLAAAATPAQQRIQSDTTHQPPSASPLDAAHHAQNASHTAATIVQLRQQLESPTSVAAAAAAATTISSVAAGVLASVLSPQTLAAITGTAAIAQCAVCAAAACQSRLPNPVAGATLTSCSCLHHHHHHLHCHHHHQTLPPPACTLCGSNVVNVSPTPTTSTMQGSHTIMSNNNDGNVAINMQQPISQQSSIELCSSTSLSTSSANLANNIQQSISQHPNQIQQQRMMLGNRHNSSSSSNLTNLTIAHSPQQQPQQPQSSISIGINASLNASAGAAAVAAAHSLYTHQQAASLSPSAVTAMLLNSAAAMGQQQTMAGLSAQQQQIPSLYSLQRSATLNEAGLAAAVAAATQAQHMNTIQQSLLANRLAQQERERETANQFYQQQQLQQRAAHMAAQAAAAAVQHHHHLMHQMEAPPLMRPLIMMPQRLPVHMAHMDLSSLVLFPNHPDAALVLNGGGASALAHTTVNPHHIVANAMATAAVPEPQPIGASLEQIKKHSQKLSYVEDPEIPEQERERCTVCLCEFETGDELRGLNCGHLFHTECIDPWLQQNKKCPLCRTEMDKAIDAVAGSSQSAENAAVILNAATAYAQASATSSTTTGSTTTC